MSENPQMPPADEPLLPPNPVDVETSPAPGDPAAPAALQQPTLTYRDVREDRKGKTKRFLLHMLGGFAVALVICAGCFALLFAVGTKVDRASSPAERRAVAPLAWASLVGVAVIVVGVIWWGIRAQRRRGRTGFLVGMLLGVGLSLLPLGLCYAIIGDDVLR